MKILLSVLLSAALLAGCSDSSDRRSVAVMPPVDPPVEPPPEPPMQPSFAAFARSVFADEANAQPRQVNDMEFNQDAADDDFSDLL